MGDKLTKEDMEKKWIVGTRILYQCNLYDNQGNIRGKYFTFKDAGDQTNIKK